MKYEHTISAILLLIVGVYLLMDSILIAVRGPQWFQFGFIGIPFVIDALKFIVYNGFIFGPILMAVGFVGIYRELWVRAFENDARSL